MGTQITPTVVSTLSLSILLLSSTLYPARADTSAEPFHLFRNGQPTAAIVLDETTFRRWRSREQDRQGKNDVRIRL